MSLYFGVKRCLAAVFFVETTSLLQEPALVLADSFHSFVTSRLKIPSSWALSFVRHSVRKPDAMVTAGERARTPVVLTSHHGLKPHL